LLRAHSGSLRPTGLSTGQVLPPVTRPTLQRTGARLSVASGARTPAGPQFDQPGRQRRHLEATRTAAPRACEPPRQIGDESRAANLERFKIAQEAFGGVKDVKVAGLEDIFVERYRVPSLRMTLTQVAIKVLSDIPSFVMQGLIFGGIMVMLLYLLNSRGGLQEALPILSLYVFAGYRLMPSLQAIYGHVATMRFNTVVLEKLYPDLRIFQQDHITKNADVGIPDKSQPLGLRKALELDNVYYRYPGADRYNGQGKANAEVLGQQPDAVKVLDCPVNHFLCALVDIVLQYPVQGV